MDGRKRYWLSLLLAFLVLAAVLLPQRLTQIACDKFAKPLYIHAIPEGSRLVQKSAAKGKDGSMTATLILATDMEGEELRAFFEDGVYPPAKKGQTVVLDAKALDESSLEALARAGLRREGETYWFVYIYSA